MELGPGTHTGTLQTERLVVRSCHPQVQVKIRQDTFCPGPTDKVRTLVDAAEWEFPFS